MEFWILILTIICIWISIRSLLYLLPNKKRLPPGPPTVPFLGNFLWLLKSSNNFSSLEPVIRQLKQKYGPIVTLQLGSQPSIFISDHAYAHQALVQSGPAFASRPPPLQTTNVLFGDLQTFATGQYGPTWRLLRHNFTILFHPKRLHLYAEGRRWAWEVLRDRIRMESQSDKSATVVEHFQFAIFCVMVYMCLGEKYEEEVVREIETVQRATITNFIRFNVLNFMPMLGKFVFRKLWNELKEIRHNQDKVFLPLIKRRQEKIQRNLDNKEHPFSYLDCILDLQIPDAKRKFSDLELVSLCSEFLHGGTDTSISTIQWVMANLVKHQDIQETLLQEINSIVPSGCEIKEEDLYKMNYLRAVVLETLRRHPPGHFVLPHAVIEDTKLAGYDIPKTAMINFTVADMSRDPKVWENPMEFRPERFIRNGEVIDFDVKGVKEIKMMPFGAGRRVCPAISVALMHQEFLVANLIREFKWKPENGCEIDLSEKQDFTMVMKNPLKVCISPRS